LIPECRDVLLSQRKQTVNVVHVAAIAMCDAEEQLLSVPDTDFVTKKKLCETMGDGCVAVKNYAKALEYYRMMLEVCS
jgi:hypothetical protein